MPDTLFGVSVPEYPPAGVFPYDPDVNFKRGRKWKTDVFRFSPLLEQRYARADSPLITFQIGFSVMKGPFAAPSPGRPDSEAVFHTLWEFFNDHLGRGLPFYYYDPVLWKRYPSALRSTGGVNYRDDPTRRVSHPGGLSGLEAGYTATTGRYVALFDADEMSYDLFQARLRKTELNIQCFVG